MADALIELDYLSTSDQVELRRVWGVGDTVCEWEEATERCPLSLPFWEVLEVIRDESQWFYDLDVSLASRHFRFGVFDSSFVYIEGPDRMVQSLTRFFPGEESFSGALPF
ncbi:hypothetical protein FIV42_14675 [Persicimonas caeni]|uniref:Uncharacterized protein n=1 Tax=Persicimonas caeni TaxID=2292766 RepID=A0A4Y6PVB5_PERCE|nr:hypothetical protein [Persicimonas caeni]QDG51937.1 hypothetical protein FIV42_14675 [Persicimonas caeni]QED33158.1 hypothetical protein FRD00_14670 [Persicimonas caeni]